MYAYYKNELQNMDLNNVRNYLKSHHSEATVINTWLIQFQALLYA